MSDSKVENSLLWIVCLLVCTDIKETMNVTANTMEDIVFDMNNTVTLFECGKPVVLRCYGSVNSFVYWQIDYVIMLNTSYSAQCVSGFECFVFNNFTGMYAYSYNSTTGISDLRIDPVTKEDDGRKYKCNDGHQYPLHANVNSIKSCV